MIRCRCGCGEVSEYEYATRKCMWSVRYRQSAKGRRNAGISRAIKAHERLNDYKLEHGCLLCGERRHPSLLEFHHVLPWTKEHAVSQMTHAHPWDAIRREIDKCVLLCANCHRLVEAGVAEIPEEIESGIRSFIRSREDTSDPLGSRVAPIDGPNDGPAGVSPLNLQMDVYECIAEAERES
jgi:hypothetical protein